MGVGEWKRQRRKRCDQGRLEGKGRAVGSKKNKKHGKSVRQEKKRREGGGAGAAAGSGAIKQEAHC
eukprot:5725987-Prymnesium_polylepis.1